jgi:hypothetical protein
MEIYAVGFVCVIVGYAVYPLVESLKGNWSKKKWHKRLD